MSYRKQPATPSPPLAIRLPMALRRGSALIISKVTALRTQIVIPVNPWNLPAHPWLRHNPQLANVLCAGVLDMIVVLKFESKIKDTRLFELVNARHFHPRYMPWISTC